MQPIYVTLTSTGASLWKIPNWQATPQQLSFAVISSAATAGSCWFVDVTYEDPSGTYPSPNSSAPTAFTILTGSSNQAITIGSNSSIGPIAGYRFTLNTQSSAGARVTLICNQAGIG